MSEQQHFFSDGRFTGIGVRNDRKSAAFPHFLQKRRQSHNEIFCEVRTVMAARQMNVT
jgi:hypothetical protein